MLAPVACVAMRALALLSFHWLTAFAACVMVVLSCPSSHRLRLVPKIEGSHKAPVAKSLKRSMLVAVLENTTEAALFERF